MSRPDFVKHYSEIQDEDNSHYPGSDELLSIDSPFSRALGLTRIGVHHEFVPPGRRISWPHAERDEEEFVYVIAGTPDMWIDGELHRLQPGDGVAFPAGTGIAHTFMNNTETDVQLLVVGEASRYSSKIHYPMHPARNAEIGERWWADVPERPLGDHDGLPDALRS